jgi:uncharacterized membrane protein YphA (DoxX/SURF4 family)
MTQFLQSFGLLIARLGTGGILLLHGITHWTGANQGVAAMRTATPRSEHRTPMSPPGRRSSSSWSAGCS